MKKGGKGFMITEIIHKQAVSITTEYNAVLITALQSIDRLIVTLTKNHFKNSRRVV